MALKTQKQIADELNCSKTRIYRYIVRNEIEADFSRGNTQYYSEETVDMIKAELGPVLESEKVRIEKRKNDKVISGHFADLNRSASIQEDPRKNTADNVISSEDKSENFHGEAENELASLQRQFDEFICIMEQQLAAKDKQISEKDKQLETLGAAFTSSQSALASAQRALAETTAALREAQALHAGTMIQERMIESADAAKPEPDSRNQGFFSKLFGRKIL